MEAESSRRRQEGGGGGGRDSVIKTRTHTSGRWWEKPSDPETSLAVDPPPGRRTTSAQFELSLRSVWRPNPRGGGRKEEEEEDGIVSLKREPTHPVGGGKYGNFWHWGS